MLSLKDRAKEREGKWKKEKTRTDEKKIEPSGTWLF